jgi:Flp pilus assembly protein TadG
MMRTMSLRLFSLLREFASERRGNVAIIFAFALIPIIGFVGAAIDYSRGNVVKVEMQSALDSVGLMLYKTAPTLSVDQLQSAAQSYFLAVFAGRYGANNIKVSATYSTTGGSNVDSRLAGTAKCFRFPCDWQRSPDIRKN